MAETLEQMISNVDLDIADPYLALELKERKPPIFRIPTYIKKRNRKSFEPQIVSIGPYHYGKLELMPMQVHKKRALAHFVKRSGKSVQVYVDRLMEDVNQLRDCYEQIDSMQVWQDDASLVQLMMVDGVFLIEFLSVLRGNQRKKDYAGIDPIFGHDGHMLIYDTMMQDLLLLENQLPYQVLATLLSVSEGLPEKSIQSILSWMMFSSRKGQGHHLLDMYMKGLVGEGQTFQEEEEERNMKYSASQLHKYGTQFKRVQSVNKIKFDKRTAILRLPSIIINKYTISKFHNLKAYELRVGRSRNLNSFVRLVDMLVESSNDVMLLQSKGIIVSSLDSNAVVEVVKELAKDTLLDVNCKSSLVFKEITEYCEEKSTNNLRMILDDWASILVLAVTVLLVLSVFKLVF
ncbi:hypothetical protein MKW94_014331 [Papaver nudicaule]|uniref:Uncharacterized protein n=1 Tax=Papaver nudicaule TaxID=74823 RepID=A0AA41RRP4_PAPNU|nr:hypothetical protein [Papaver nudicaule]